MPEFLSAFLAGGLATLGGREAVRCARLSSAMGGAWPIAAAVGLAAMAGSGAMAWAGAGLAELCGPGAGRLLAGGAMLLAAAQIWLLRAGTPPREPTRSFGAIFIVFVTALTTGAVGLAALAVALAGGAFWPVAMGSALGSGIVLLIACGSGGGWEDAMPAQWLRPAAAIMLALGGIMMAALPAG